jgi:hypothetical protein
MPYRATLPVRSKRGAVQSRHRNNGEIDATGAERPQQHFYRDFARSDHAQPYTNDSGYADFMESDDALAELLRRSAFRYRSTA